MTTTIISHDTDKHYINIRQNGSVFEVSVFTVLPCGILGSAIRKRAYTDKSKAMATYNRYKREFA